MVRDNDAGRDTSSAMRPIPSAMRFPQSQTDGSRSNRVPVGPYIAENPRSIWLISIPIMATVSREYRYPVNVRDQRFRF